ncbi:hypothetical protein OM416_19170 [Paenibacillus sp. LS1]|nr:hypothetical protein [Paenibacillus sp. LS1]MCW3793717.1 hypothetical protein [Paenibacillus sp. LS1]
MSGNINEYVFKLTKEDNELVAREFSEGDHVYIHAINRQMINE